MQQALRYFKRRLDKGVVCRATLDILRESDDPHVIEFFCDLLEQPDYQNENRSSQKQVLFRAGIYCMRESDNPRCRDILLGYYSKNIRYAIGLHNLPLFKDERLIPYLLKYFDMVKPEIFAGHAPFYDTRLKALINIMGDNALPIIEEQVKRFSRDLNFRAYAANHPLWSISQQLKQMTHPAAVSLARETQELFNQTLRQHIADEVSKYDMGDLQYALISFFKRNVASSEEVAIELVTHKNLYVRKAALIYLAGQIYENRKPPANPRYENLMKIVLDAYHKQENSSFRASIYKCLMYIEDIRITALAIPFLKAHFKGEEVEIGFKYLLAALGSNKNSLLQRRIIHHLLQNGMFDSRNGWIVDYLAGVGTELSVEQIINITQHFDSSTMIVAHAMNALGKLSKTHDSALNQLCIYLTSESHRLMAIIALRHSNERAIPILVNLPVYDAREYRELVVSLGELNLPECLPYLSDYLLGLSETSDFIFQTVASAIERIGTESAYEILNDWRDTYAS